jgi:hypothetical protein
MYRIEKQSGEVVAYCSTYRDAVAMVNTNLKGILKIVKESDNAKK